MEKERVYKMLQDKYDGHEISIKNIIEIVAEAAYLINQPDPPKQITQIRQITVASEKVYKDKG